MNCRNNLIPLCFPRTKLPFSTGTTSTAPRQQGITMTAILQAVNRDKTNYQCLQSTSSKYYLKSLSTCCLPFLCFHRLNLREVKGNSQSDSKMKGKMLRKVFLYCSGKCTFFPLAQEQKRESGSFPSPKPTLTLSSHLGQNVGLGEGIHWL